MANDNQIQMDFIINDKSVKTQFSKIENQAKDTAKKIDESADGSSFSNVTKSVKGLSSSLTGLVGIYAGVSAAVIYASKQFYDFVIAGEQATAINYQFKAAAESAGLASDQLAASLIKATDGLIDDDEALQLATKSIIALGNEAKELPRILELSRAVSKSLGKDFKETFADLSQFLEAGNLKALRQYGIVLDLESAYKKAAQSIGVATSELSEQQKQAIRTGLLLDELPKKFNAAAQSVTPLSDAFTRFYVSFKNKLEDIGKSIAETLARSFVDNADKSNVATARLNSQLEETSTKIDSINKRIEEIKLDKLGSKSVQAAAEIESLNRSLKGLISEREKLMVESSGRSDKEVFDALSSFRDKPKQGLDLKLNDEQIKAQKERALDLTKFIQQQDLLILQSNLEVVNQKDSINQQITSQQLRAQQELEVLALQHRQNLLEIDKQFSKEKLFSTEQANQAKNASDKAYLAQREKIILDSALKVAEIEKTIEETRIERVKSVADTLKQTLLNSTANYIEKMGESLGRGEDMFKDFGDSVVGIMGDLAISIGKTLLFTGPAIEAFITAVNGLVPGSGLVAAAVGAGLILFGSALKSSVGKGGGASSSAPSSGFVGGGIGSTPINNSELQPRGAQVQVNISGDVFDTEATGLRIVDILNKSFDQQGVTVRGMA